MLEVDFKEPRNAMSYQQHLEFLKRHADRQIEPGEKRRAEAELAGYVAQGRDDAPELPPTCYTDAYEQMRFEMGWSDAKWLKERDKTNT